MLCEKCGKNKATHTLTQIINGMKEQLNLCNECANEYKFNSLADEFNYFDFSLHDLMNSFFNFNGLQPNNMKTKSIDNEQNIQNESSRCPQCGKSITEISNSGKIGCATCYSEFKRYLTPSIERLHGKVSHIGKIPSSADIEIKAKHHLKTLKSQLNECIKSQEFEKAIKIRDEINEIENQMKGGQIK